jgi:hypothetical protein
LWNCGVAVTEQPFFKSCGIAIAEVFPSSCRIVIADSKNKLRMPTSDQEKEALDKTNLERLKKKYPWWLSSHQEEGPVTSSKKADLDDTVSLFEGKNTCV